MGIRMLFLCLFVFICQGSAFSAEEFSPSAEGTISAQIRNQQDIESFTGSLEKLKKDRMHAESAIHALQVFNTTAGNPLFKARTALQAFNTHVMAAKHAVVATGAHSQQLKEQQEQLGRLQQEAAASRAQAERAGVEAAQFKQLLAQAAGLTEEEILRAITDFKKSLFQMKWTGDREKNYVENLRSVTVQAEAGIKVKEGFDEDQHVAPVPLESYLRVSGTKQDVNKSLLEFSARVVKLESIIRTQRSDVRILLEIAKELLMEINTYSPSSTIANGLARMTAKVDAVEKNSAEIMQRFQTMEALFHTGYHNDPVLFAHQIQTQRKNPTVDLGNYAIIIGMKLVKGIGAQEGELGPTLLDAEYELGRIKETIKKEFIRDPNNNGLYALTVLLEELNKTIVKLRATFFTLMNIIDPELVRELKFEPSDTGADTKAKMKLDKKPIDKDKTIANIKKKASAKVSESTEAAKAKSPKSKPVLIAPEFGLLTLLPLADEYGNMLVSNYLLDLIGARATTIDFNEIQAIVSEGKATTEEIEKKLSSEVLDHFEKLRKEKFNWRNSTVIKPTLWKALCESDLQIGAFRVSSKSTFQTFLNDLLQEQSAEQTSFKDTRGSIVGTLTAYSLERQTFDQGYDMSLKTDGSYFARLNSKVHDKAKLRKTFEGVFAIITKRPREHRQLAKQLEKVITAYSAHKEFITQLEGVRILHEVLTKRVPADPNEKSFITYKKDQLTKAVTSPGQLYLGLDPLMRATYFAYNFPIFSFKNLQDEGQNTWAGAPLELVEFFESELISAHGAYQKAKEEIMAVNPKGHELRGLTLSFGGFDSTLTPHDAQNLAGKLTKGFADRKLPAPTQLIENMLSKYVHGAALSSAAGASALPSASALGSASSSPLMSPRLSPSSSSPALLAGGGMPPPPPPPPGTHSAAHGGSAPPPPPPPPGSQVSPSAGSGLSSALPPPPGGGAAKSSGFSEVEFQAIKNKCNECHQLFQNLRTTPAYLALPEPLQRKAEPIIPDLEKELIQSPLVQLISEGMSYWDLQPPTPDDVMHFLNQVCNKAKIEAKFIEMIEPAKLAARKGTSSAQVAAAPAPVLFAGKSGIVRPVHGAAPVIVVNPTTEEQKEELKIFNERDENVKLMNIRAYLDTPHVGHTTGPGFSNHFTPKQLLAFSLDQIQLLTPDDLREWGDDDFEKIKQIWRHISADEIKRYKKETLLGSYLGGKVLPIHGDKAPMK